MSKFSKENLKMKTRRHFDGVFIMSHVFIIFPFENFQNKKGATLRTE